MMAKTIPTYRELHYVHRGILDPYRYASQVTLRCYEPSASMQPFVDCFFVARWDRPGEAAYATTDILTRPVVNIFFTKEGARVSTVLQGPRTFIIDQKGVYAGVKFKPGGFHAFVKQPMAQIIGKVTPADQIIPGYTTPFAKQLLKHTDNNRIVHEMEQALAARQPQSDKKAALVNDMVTSVENKEFHTVQELAAEFNYSQRTLQHLFREYVGVGPKWMLMRSRLLRAVQEVLTPDKPNWTEVAAELNYSTQSHFTNDFRRLIGMSPRQYANSVLMRR